MNVERLREEIEFGLSNLDKIHSRILTFKDADVERQIMQSAFRPPDGSVRRSVTVTNPYGIHDGCTSPLLRSW